MSRTAVMLIDENGVTTDVAELSNAWGSAAFVWSALGKRYLDNESAWVCNDEGAKRVWALWKDPRLFTVEQIVLLSTFDGAIIEHERFYDAAEAFAEFEAHHRSNNAVCHMGTISGLLLKHQETPCLGMCFHQTSITEDPWLGEYDEETEDYKPFDMNAGKHFFVFQDLAKMIDEK